jgi:3-hydroxybutyryl-CoA dehydrogenase
VSTLRITILGLGRMGRGIAVAFARYGTSVVLLDGKPRSPDAYAKLCGEARDEIIATFAALRAAGDPFASETADPLACIAFAPLGDKESALTGADVLFEAVTETIEIKRQAFAAIAAALSPQTIVASTSSTFTSTDVAKLVEEPRRCLNAHWLNPAYLIPLVEVSPHQDTDEDVIARLDTILTQHGKKPVRCAPIAGYIVPRLQTLVMNEAARMVEEGVASADAIDTAIRFGFGIRYANMGVLEFVDFGGGDILHYASAYLAAALGREDFKSPDIIAKHMEAGDLGLKTGRGFYDWSSLDVAAYRAAFLARLIAQVVAGQGNQDDEKPHSLY